MTPNTPLHATQKERMSALETRMEGLIQWHQDLGDRVESLEAVSAKVDSRLAKVESRLGELGEQISGVNAVNTSNNLMLRELTACIVGITQKGMERPGLADDVRLMKGLIEDNNDRLDSLERTKATLIWAGGTLSTAITGILFWVWSHTDQILTTVTNVYGRPKTEQVAPVDSK